MCFKNLQKEDLILFLSGAFLEQSPSSSNEPLSSQTGVIAREAWRRWFQQASITSGSGQRQPAAGGGKPMRCSLGPDTRMDGFCRASRQVGWLRGGGASRGGGGGTWVRISAHRQTAAQSRIGECQNLEAVSSFCYMQSCVEEV